MAKRRDTVDASDPANLQPEQRQREVAAILAAGVIRTARSGKNAGARDGAPGSPCSRPPNTLPEGRMLARFHFLPGNGITRTHSSSICEAWSSGGFCFGGRQYFQRAITEFR